MHHASGPVAAPCLPTSLLQPLMKLAQSFVLANPEEPDCPIVYASQRFLDLTGYPRYLASLAGVTRSVHWILFFDCCVTAGQLACQDFGSPSLRQSLVDLLHLDVCQAQQVVSPSGINFAVSSVPYLLGGTRCHIILSSICRDRVVGRNCRFLQGPGTDSESVRQLREGIKAGGPVTVSSHCNLSTA